MSVEINTICNRCGGRFTHGESQSCSSNTRTIQASGFRFFHSFNHSDDPDQFDLCSYCTAEFENFMRI